MSDSKSVRPGSNPGVGATKVCSKCKHDLPLEEFPKRKNSKDGRAYRCKTCTKQNSKENYKQKATHYINKVKQRNVNYRDRNRRFVFEYLKNHPCVDCGESDPVVLEFDHLSDKECNISSLAVSSYSLKKIEEEIAKCEVCCANCHRKRTAKRGGWHQLSF